MKNILYILVGYLISFQSSFAALSKEDIIPITENNIVTNATEADSFLGLFSSAKSILFTVVGVVAVAMFMYSGFQIIMSFGKPDEFKKAFKNFLYTIVGIVIVALSYALVSMVAGLDF